MSIIAWIALVILYLLIGLTVCQMNREIRANWGKWMQEQTPKLFIFFPNSLLENELGAWEGKETNRNSFWYNLFLLLFWPLRIFLLPFAVFVLYLVIGWIWIFCASAKKIAQLGLTIYKNSFVALFATLSGYFSEKPKSGQV